MPSESVLKGAGENSGLITGRQREKLLKDDHIVIH